MEIETTTDLMGNAMTVGELIDALEQVDEAAEVRLAMQPAWPFAYSIGMVLETRVDGKHVVYIAEKDQLGYLVEETKDALGW